MTQGQGRRGRKPKPIKDAKTPVGCIAAQLRKLKERSGNPSYEILQELCNVSKSALAEAAGSNGSFPTWNVAGEYVRSCLLYGGRDDGYVARVLDRWEPYWKKQEHAHNSNGKATVEGSIRLENETDFISKKEPKQHSGEAREIDEETDPRESRSERKTESEDDDERNGENGLNRDERKKVVAVIIIVLSSALVLAGFFWWQSSQEEPKTWSARIVGTYSAEHKYHIGAFKYRSPDIPRDTDGSFYPEGDVVQIVCQKRDGRETPPDSVTGKTSRVWDKTVEGFWISDMYTDLPKVEGDTPPSGIPLC